MILSNIPKSNIKRNCWSREPIGSGDSCAVWPQWGNAALIPARKVSPGKALPLSQPHLSLLPRPRGQPGHSTQGVLQPHLSASSNTTYSTLCSFRFISTATCIKRPGVAMILQGVCRAGHPGPGTPAEPSSHPQPSAIWEGTPEYCPQSILTYQGFHARPKTGLPF